CAKLTVLSVRVTSAAYWVGVMSMTVPPDPPPVPTASPPPLPGKKEPPDGVEGSPEGPEPPSGLLEHAKERLRSRHTEIAAGRISNERCPVGGPGIFESE